MTPKQWTEVLAPDEPWQKAYAVVATEARAMLSDNVLFAGKEVSTGVLADSLFPVTFARGDGILARRRLFRALLALAPRELADCCHRGEAKRMRHSTRLIRPWIWHAPRERNSEAEELRACPHCGGIL